MSTPYRSIDLDPSLDRREFVRAVAIGAVATTGAVLGGPAFSQTTPAPAVETNVDDFLKTPRGPHSLPGPFPGRVVKVIDDGALRGDVVDAKVVRAMVERGVRALTGVSMKDSFALFFTREDVVGIKVNPVGFPLIHTKPEVVEAVIRWLVDGGVKRDNIVIWDRFDYMLKDAGYTAARFPGVRIEGLQTMDESGGEGWKKADGTHVSAANFDPDAFYLARGVTGTNVRGYQDDAFYHNQHVFTGEQSFFGALVTRRLTRIINLAAYKNTGNGISMATKNLGYGSLCNTGRLHAPLSLKVSTEVLAAPWIREKLVFNITDGLRGQYDGGPDKNEQFVYPNHALYFGTDPFAMDMVCHREIVAKRKAMGVQVNENPRFTEYLHYAEKLGLGVVDPARLRLHTVRT